ncbi:NnrS family protein [Paraglaciecola aquimarina]|uniref:NnrS family protein n=1 Tax=Paraglaciecola algarum TaxID=3050085 RepID=A0ABS9D7D7_9ALTE|nr:NnrS family protein [Paraglaciecola sp. G1-23]MCF2948317.1 NnrS family protein [Paraglaciecola sp. G1-23]
MNITDPRIEQKIPAIWRQAFRPMFLIGSLFAIICMSIWALFLSGNLSFTPYGGMFYWHGHEMMFGFVGAILVGFLLTAVQNWTGLRATHGKPLIALFSLWLTARLLIVSNLLPLLWLTALIDILFLVLAAALMAQLVLKVKQYRNLIFVPILLLLACANGLTHLSVLLADPSFYVWGMYASVAIITLIMTVITGRIVPMFTANGTQTQKVPNLAWLETLVIGSTLLITLIYLANLPAKLPKLLMVSIFIAAALVHGFRAIRWRPQVTINTPLVWSLHLAYWFIPISFVLFAMHYWGLNVALSSALHGLTAGAISSLILAMLARITLGHTGRPLTPHWAIKYSFGLIILAGITRLTAQPLQTSIDLNIYIIAAIFWITAYVIYLIFYWRILTSPRPDGRPG